MIRKREALQNIMDSFIVSLIRTKEGDANSVLILPAEEIQEFD